MAPPAGHGTSRAGQPRPRRRDSHIPAPIAVSRPIDIAVDVSVHISIDVAVDVSAVRSTGPVHPIRAAWPARSAICAAPVHASAAPMHPAPASVHAAAMAAAAMHRAAASATSDLGDEAVVDVGRGVRPREDLDCFGLRRDEARERERKQRILEMALEPHGTNPRLRRISACGRVPRNAEFLSSKRTFAVLCGRSRTRNNRTPYENERRPKTT